MFHMTPVSREAPPELALALLALEETTQEARYRKPRRTVALRFALAFLYDRTRANRAPYDDFWKALDETSMWRFQSADRALNQIYMQLGLERDERIAFRFWERFHSEHRT